jgi:hypothetical protein
MFLEHFCTFLADILLLSGNLTFTLDYVLYGVLALQPCGDRQYHPTPSACMDDKLKNHRMDFYDVFIFENL